MGKTKAKYSVVIADANRNFMLLLKEYLGKWMILKSSILPFLEKKLYKNTKSIIQTS